MPKNKPDPSIRSIPESLILITKDIDTGARYINMGHIQLAKSIVSLADNIACRLPQISEESIRNKAAVMVAALHRHFDSVANRIHENPFLKNRFVAAYRELIEALPVLHDEIIAADLLSASAKPKKARKGETDQELRRAKSINDLWRTKRFDTYEDCAQEYGGGCKGEEVKAIVDRFRPHPRKNKR
jgi:hypothetical protein